MKIGIVGLGIAGLRAAMLLERAGAEVELFEARGRLGGRMHTTPEGDEAGGEWIDADHSRCIQLLSEVGLVAEAPESSSYRICYGGGEGLSPEAAGDLASVERAADKLVRRVDPTPWNNLSLAKHDHTSLSSFLDKHCSSDAGRWWTEAHFRSDEGDDTDRIGLLGWLCGRAQYSGRERESASAYRIPGGAAALIPEMAASLRARPVLNAPLRKVSCSAKGVTLDFDAFQVSMRRVILTLPPPCLRQIEFDPPLPPHKTKAIEDCRMGRAIKISLEFAKSFWNEEGWHGNLFTDSLLQQVWSTKREGRHLLHAYVCGTGAAELLKMPDPLRVALDLLSTFSPGAAQSYIRGEVHDWISDPYSQGGFSHLAPGYVLGGMAHIASPVDSIHFAGEHTGLWTGFIEGAIESAERVAKEVLAPQYAVALLD